MFQIDDDLTIYVTRGDIAFFSVSAESNGELYTFKKGDVVRMKVTEKKKCSNVAFQKEFVVLEKCTSVNILLTEEETKIGDVISKPKDYWYEIELNPYTNPQTIIGYDEEDGPKIFKLFPEGRDLGNTTKKEDVPVVDKELSLTSTRPVENQAVTRGLLELEKMIGTGGGSGGTGGADDDDEVRTGLFLIDTATNRQYELKVVNGKLTMEECTGVSGKLRITKQPQSVTVMDGEGARFTIEADSTEPNASMTYRWMYRMPDENTWQEFSYILGASVGFATCSLEHNGRLVRCLVSDGVNEVMSDTVTLYVVEDTGEDEGGDGSWTFEITEQPQDVTIYEGEDARFEIAFDTTYTGEINCYWDFKSASTDDWSCSSSGGLTKAFTYHDCSKSYDGMEVRCRIALDNGHTFYSRKALLTVKEIPQQGEDPETPVVPEEPEEPEVPLEGVLTVIKEPVDTTIYEGEDAVFSIEVETTVPGATIGYTWSYLDVDTDIWLTPVDGNGTNTFSFKSCSRTMDGTKVRCQVRDGLNSDVSEVATLTVKRAVGTGGEPGALKITKQPQNIIATEGSEVWFEIEAETTPGCEITYSWEHTMPDWDGDWIPLYSKTNRQGFAEITSDLNGKMIRCTVDDGHNTVISNVATLTVAPPLVITKQPQNVTVANYTNATLSVEAEGDGLTYQWYQKTQSAVNFVAVGYNGTKPTFTTFAALSSNDMQYYCQITDAYGRTIISDVVTIHVTE